jgi:hypothetical protein
VQQRAIYGLVVAGLRLVGGELSGEHGNAVVLGGGGTGGNGGIGAANGTPGTGGLLGAQGLNGTT